jgi:ABC-2 type transport system ATP-binding protein
MLSRSQREPGAPGRALSGGREQRLSIVLALIGQAEAAVLDELTTGLDPEPRRETWGPDQSVRDSGVTIVLVTHFMEEAERLCDRRSVLVRERRPGEVLQPDAPAYMLVRGLHGHFSSRAPP